MSEAFQIKEHTIPGQFIREYPTALRHNQEGLLRIAVKQYIPLDRPDPIPPNAVTILVLHANGFPKETYEPYLTALYRHLQHKNVPVRAIWMADSSNQGASGVLNENEQGDMPSWFDHSRDLLSMVNYFRNEMSRPFVGVAHSYSCAQLIQLSIIHPRLLSALILCEPTLVERSLGRGNPALMPSIRRDIWPTRGEAESKLRKAFGFLQPQVVDQYLRYGLRPVPTILYDPAQKSSIPTQAVTLTTTKHQESWTSTQINFDAPDEDMDRLVRADQDHEVQLKQLAARPEMAMTIRNLPHLRPDVLYVFGGKSPISSKTEQDKKMKITGTGLGGSGGEKAGKVKKIVFQKGGHLIPFEKGTADEYAKASATYLEEWFSTYLRDEKIRSEHKYRGSDAEMLRLSDEWMEAVKLDSRAPRPFRSSKPAKL